MARLAKVVSKTELAGVLHLSRGRVTQLIGEGLPVRPDGKLDRAEAVAWYHANVRDGQKRGPKPESDQSAPADESLKAAQTRKERALATIRELEAGEKSGSLLDRDEVKEAVSGMIMNCRSRLLMIPDQVGDRLASMSDPVACRELVSDEICRALAELAEYPRTKKK